MPEMPIRPRSRAARRAPGRAALAASPLAAALAIGCAAAPRPGPDTTPGEAPGPYALVLGTAQDGGLPQIGCRAEACERARAEPSRARRASALLVVDPGSGKRWLFDAGPDLPEQVELARGHPPGHPSDRPAADLRPALFDGVFLTHAHVGHYAGLIHLGREVYGASGTPLFASRQMASFLSSNGPWNLMVHEGHLALIGIEADLPVPLAGGLRVTPIPVPHRHEYTDTLAFVVEGPRGSLLYLPDIDKWERWDRRVEDLIARVDVALVDGTFFADGEIAGRSMVDIPHPFIAESLERFAALPADERAKIHFTHLNHTNPAVDPEAPAAAAIRAAGMHVAREGQRIDL